MALRAASFTEGHLSSSAAERRRPCAAARHSPGFALRALSQPSGLNCGVGGQGEGAAVSGRAVRRIRRKRPRAAEAASGAQQRAPLRRCQPRPNPARLDADLQLRDLLLDLGRAGRCESRCNEHRAEEPPDHRVHAVRGFVRDSNTYRGKAAITEEQGRAQKEPGGAAERRAVPLLSALRCCALPTSRAGAALLSALAFHATAPGLSRRWQCMSALA